MGQKLFMQVYIGNIRFKSFSVHIFYAPFFSLKAIKCVLSRCSKNNPSENLAASKAWTVHQSKLSVNMKNFPSINIDVTFEVKMKKGNKIAFLDVYFTAEFICVCLLVFLPVTLFIIHIKLAQSMNLSGLL